MDKEILVVIGKLYLELYTLGNYAESLKNKVTELEKAIKDSSGPSSSAS